MTSKANSPRLRVHYVPRGYASALCGRHMMTDGGGHHGTSVDVHLVNCKPCLARIASIRSIR